MHAWTGAPITLSAPDVAEQDLAAVRDVLLTRDLSCGPKVTAFEAAWAARFGSRHAVAISSGTAALHVAMIAAGVRDHDLVITTPFSFVASSNAILYERGLPVFVDIDAETLAIDPARAAEAAECVSAGRAQAAPWLPPAVEGPIGALKALLPVHIFGRPAPMTALLAIGDAHGIPVVEDACEAIGTSCAGRPAGTLGRAGVFGFYPNKQMTTGEGGMLVTDDDEWARLARSLRNQGRNLDQNWLEYNRLGYNYRLDDLSAALGLSQLTRLDELLARRRAIASLYDERLAGTDEILLPSANPDASWFVYVVRVPDGIDRDRVMDRLAAVGVPTRAYFPPIHLQPYYRERFGFREGMFPVAEMVGRQSLALPFHNHLSVAEIDYVCDQVRAVVRTE